MTMPAIGCFLNAIAMIKKNPNTNGFARQVGVERYIMYTLREQEPKTGKIETEI